MATGSQELFTFDVEGLSGTAERLRGGYASARPFPHAVIDDFLPEPVARQLLRSFPAPDSDIWLDWKKRDIVHQPKKLGIGAAGRLRTDHPFIQHVLFAFNSYPVIHFLEQLTGIEGLIPDPHYSGGGLHQILPGGKLAIHSDFNVHPLMKVWRRLNLLLYLNEDWRADYGGNLELWDGGMNRCIKSIAPLFNRCVVFNTDRRSYHGHPEPLNTPEGVTRKSLALYYYSAAPAPGEDEQRPVLWQRRPQEAVQAVAGDA